MAACVYCGAWSGHKPTCRIAKAILTRKATEEQEKPHVPAYWNADGFLIIDSRHPRAAWELAMLLWERTRQVEARQVREAKLGEAREQ